MSSCQQKQPTCHLTCRPWAANLRYRRHPVLVLHAPPQQWQKPNRESVGTGGSNVYSSLLATVRGKEKTVPIPPQRTTETKGRAVQSMKQSRSLLFPATEITTPRSLKDSTKGFLMRLQFTHPVRMNVYPRFASNLRKITWLVLPLKTK